MGHFLSAVVEPGFFHSAPVQVALVTGGLVAVVSGIIGSFAVIRGQSYAGHALADISVTGGSASFLVGVSPLWGLVGVGVVAAGIMDMIGIRRPRGRDLATGIVRGAGLGLAALFLYWDTTHSNTTGATITILFGSVSHHQQLDSPGRNAAERAGPRHRGGALPAVAAQLRRHGPGHGAGDPSASRWTAVPDGDRDRRVLVGHDHRHDPEHRAAHRGRRRPGCG